jgi:hypothetical protein
MGYPAVGGRRGPTPWILVLLIPVVASGISALTFALFALVAVLSVLLPVLAVGAALGVMGLVRRRRVLLYRGGAVVPEVRPAGGGRLSPRQDLVWARSRARFHTVCSEYAAFECDLMSVMRLPALADVTVPSTARFVEAFAEAQALETDAFPPGPHADRFIAAAERAERAWRAATEAAERIRLSGFSPAERGTVERVIKLLTTAFESANEPERLVAYGRARTELAKLSRAGKLHLPRPAQALLDAGARGALPA